MLTKTYTMIVIDGNAPDLMSRDAIKTEEWFWDSRPVAKCKGGDQANDQRKQELAMQTESFNKQMAQLDKLNGSFSRYLTPDGEGFNPALVAGLRSQALDQNALAYNGAGAGVRSALAARGSAGGDAPVGGDYVRGIASLEGAAASDRASTLTNIDLSNLQQALTNKFNAGSILSGNAATLGGTVGSTGNDASSALNSYVYAQNNGPLGKALGQFAGGLGQGLGQGVSGGLGKMFSGSSGGKG